MTSSVGAVSMVHWCQQGPGMEETVTRGWPGPELGAPVTTLVISEHNLSIYQLSRPATHHHDINISDHSAHHGQLLQRHENTLRLLELHQPRLQTGQHRAHHQCQWGQPSLGIWSAAPDLSSELGWETCRVQCEWGGVQLMQSDQPQTQDCGHLQQTSGVHVLHHHLQIIQSNTWRSWVQAWTELLLHLHINSERHSQKSWRILFLSQHEDDLQSCRQSGIQLCHWWGRINGNRRVNRKVGGIISLPQSCQTYPSHLLHLLLHQVKLLLLLRTCLLLQIQNW